MARVLILGADGRGLRLAERVAEDGYLCRIVTGARSDRAAVEAIGAECWIGDLGALATVMGALDGVTVVCWLLGSADRPHAEQAELHGPRLEAFLGRVVDTGVRGVLYEAAGAVPAQLLARGARLAEAICARNAIPLRMLDVQPCERERWLEQAQGAVRKLLGGDAS